jgi:integrase
MPHKKQHITSDFMSWEESKRVINLLYRDEDYWYCLLFTIATHFGLRISDVKKLTWDDLIRKEKVVLNEKKTGKKKIIETPENIKDFVLTLYGKIKPKGKYIVSVKHTQTINQKLKRLKEKYNIDIGNFSTHTFRKTFGRHYWEKNGRSEYALFMLMQLFNHSSLDTTKVYLGIRQDEFNQIYSNIAEEAIV